MDSDVTFVFLHGAGVGAWTWDRLIGDLSAPAIALDLRSRTADATPDRCVAEVIAELDRRDIGPVILGLHSLAAVLAPGFRRDLGSRLRQCIFISGVIPPPGGAFVDALGIMNRLILKTLFRFNPGGLKPSPAMIRRELCNDLSEEDAAVVVSRYEAEMPGLYVNPVGWIDMPGCVYVKLLKDQSVTPARQDVMIGRLDRPIVREIDAGHLAMLSAPAALAGVLMEETVGARA